MKEFQQEANKNFIELDEYKINTKRSELKLQEMYCQD